MKQMSEDKVEALAKQVKAMVDEEYRNREQISELLKQALGEKGYRRMQTETLRQMVEVFGDDPEMFHMMYEESLNLNGDGGVVPDLDLVKELLPDEFKPGKPLYLVVNNAKGKE